MNRDCSSGIRSWWCSEPARRNHARRLAVRLGLLALLCSGCIVIPTPLHRPDRSTRLNVDRQTVQSVKPGESLADVLLRLGEPDEVSLDGRQLAYRWERVWAYWFMGAGNAVAGGPFTRSRALVIDLDEQDRVRSAGIGADYLFSRPATEQVFTTEHGGKKAVEGPSSQKEGSGLNQFRGEPLEYHNSVMLYAGFDAATLAGKGFWGRLNGPPPSATAGEILLTPTAIHFKKDGTLGTDPPELSLRFKDIAAIEYHRVGFGAWIVLRHAAAAPGSFDFYSLGAGPKAKTKALFEHSMRLWRAAKERK